MLSWRHPVGSSAMKLEELVTQGKKRHAALKGMLKPFGVVSSVCSAGLWVYHFYKNSGEFTFTLLGLAALTLFLLYYATSFSGVKLLARRAFALVIDFALIGLVLFVFMSWYEANAEHPEDVLQIRVGQILMLALWLAFLYFVLFDWRFKGTLGKRFLGLTVIGVEGSKISFERLFIRNFLSLPLPVISAVLLSRWISGESQPGIRSFTGDAAKNAIISFVPLSVMFFGGNQSIADRLTNIAIRAEHEAANLLPKIRVKTWTLLCFSNLAWALLYASLWYLAVTKPFLAGPSKAPPTGAQAAWIVNDPQSVATLWTVLPMGLKEPMFGVRRIELLQEAPNPFTYRGEESHFLARLNVEPLKQLDRMPVVRVVLARDLPLQVKVLVVQNFLLYVGKNTPRERRPAFSVLQIATEKRFGLFGINEQENILVCWMLSTDNNAQDFFTDVRPHGSIQFPVSIDETGFLLMGAGIPYW
jgi:uncharacterized RDD family membrane protein YckC